jgi:hypothetical protein
VGASSRILGESEAVMLSIDEPEVGRVGVGCATGILEIDLHSQDAAGLVDLRDPHRVVLET